MSNILLYTKQACGFCDQAKMFLNNKNIPFTESVIGQDILREDFVELFPEARTAPYIIIDGVKIGGYQQLVEWYNNRPEYIAG